MNYNIMEKLMKRLIKLYSRQDLKNDYDIVLKCYYGNPIKRKWEYSIRILKNGKYHNQYGCTPEYFDMCKARNDLFDIEYYKSSSTVFLTYKK